MQELITTIGNQKVKITADENEITIEKIEDYEYSRIKNIVKHPIYLYQKNGLDIYGGLLKYSLYPLPFLVLCDKSGRILLNSVLFAISETGLILTEGCCSKYIDYCKKQDGLDSFKSYVNLLCEN